MVTLLSGLEILSLAEELSDSTDYGYKITLTTFSNVFRQTLSSQRFYLFSLKTLLSDFSHILFYHSKGIWSQNNMVVGGTVVPIFPTGC